MLKQQEDLIVSEKSGLTIREQEILELVTEAYNEFLQLPEQHSSDKEDFAKAVHILQAIIGMRIIRRNYPDTWKSLTITEEKENK